MANPEHVKILKQGVAVWNKWREKHREVKVDLVEADLTERNLRKADLRGANLARANLIKADLQGANLQEADLTKVFLTWANLTGANLVKANLVGANLIETNLEKANLTNAVVFGASVWNVRLNKTRQSNLIITPRNEPEITVDNLEIAQFIYLLLNNPKIRDVIDTITSKVVLILGRFTPPSVRIVVTLVIEDSYRI